MQSQDSTALAIEPGRLGGRYELGEILGHGGMALVRRGTDLRLGRTVAVKTLRAQLADAPAFQARFRREARAVAALDHPAIVSVYDAGEETVDGTIVLYIVMEYVDGRTLRDLVRTGPRLALDRALAITAELLDALAYSHDRGIIHRDVKPGNVMITSSGGVKVMDFGIARAVADMTATMTQTAAVIGTAHYLSPEQARGEPAGARSDVYSTGCLLYELLTGRPPFQGDSAIAVAYQHVRETPQPPSAFEPSVPAEVDAIVLRALAKQPEERYQSAEHMRNDLMAALPGEHATAPVGPVAGLAGMGGLAAGSGLGAESAEAATGELRGAATGEMQGADTGELSGGETESTAVVPSAAGAVASAETGTASPSLWERLRRRKLLLLAVTAAVVLALAAGGLALFWPAGAPDRDPRRAGAGTTSESPTQQRSGSSGTTGSSLGGSLEGGGVSQRQVQEGDRGADSGGVGSATGQAQQTSKPETETETGSTDPSDDTEPTGTQTSPPSSTPEETTPSETSPSETQSDPTTSEPTDSETAQTPEQQSS